MRSKSANEAPVKVILANDTLFLRGLLQRALHNAPQIDVVGVTGSLQQLASLLNASAADWVILSLTAEGGIPQVGSALLQAHPSLQVLAIAADGGTAKRLALAPQERAVEIRSVAEIVDLLAAPDDR